MNINQIILDKITINRYIALNLIKISHVMKKQLFKFFVFSFLIFSSTPLQAEWISLSKSLKELDIQSLAVDPKDPLVIYAGSERRVHRTLDGGDSWKQVLAVKGEGNRVRLIYVEPSNTKVVYVCTDHGLQRSEDSGSHWDYLFRGIGQKARSVFYVLTNPSDPTMLWIGTGNGLFLGNAKTGDFKKVSGLPDAVIYSILIPESSDTTLLVTTDKGIYKSGDGGIHWDRVHVSQDTVLKKEERDTLEQFDIEELTAADTFSNVIHLSSQNKFVAASGQGILEGIKDGSSWSLLQGQNLPAQKINFVAKSSKTFYAGTDLGVFQWDSDKRSFREVYKGLESGEVRTLSYSASGDFLLAGTRRGVFRWSFPELDLSVLDNQTVQAPTVRAVLARFSSEPSISEIQNVAIQYAEVHPKKIEGWRKAAALKALLPTLSVDTDLSSDQNIDLDRGGTGDPDKFIEGPLEESRDWSVGLKWDLGNLVWNDDQTSIDTRSRLMVELRDDILNEVTHLYYERRRLQIELTLSPVRDIPIQIEKEIRLQELTAGIDALTGGYLSKRLQKIAGTQTIGRAGPLDSVYHI